MSHPNATLAPQAMQARASGENLNYMTLAPQARPSGEILKYLLSHYSDILEHDHCLTPDHIYHTPALLQPPPAETEILG